MSITSQFLEGKITFQTAVSEAEAWAENGLKNVEQIVQSNPSVQSAVTGLSSAATLALQATENYAGSAISNGLAALAADIEAAVTKNLPALLGAAGTPLSAADVAAIQAAGQVGNAALSAILSATTAGKNTTAVTLPTS